MVNKYSIECQEGVKSINWPEGNRYRGEKIERSRDSSPSCPKFTDDSDYPCNNYIIINKVTH